MPQRPIRRLRTKRKLDYGQPTVIVCRSNKHILAQLLEPTTKKVLCTFHSGKVAKGTKTDKAAAVGKEMAKWLKTKKYDHVLFDRNGFVYHGRIKALAEAMRQENINI